jgi:hypothetical protein
MLTQPARSTVLIGLLMATALAIAPASVRAQTEGPSAEDADAPAGETVVISEDEARACAARLEPMVASFTDPMTDIYIRRVAGPAFQVWAPRGDEPGAPFRPWCVTTLEAISSVSFLNPDNRATVMELAAASSPEPPPARQGPPDAPAPPPTVVVEPGDEAEEPRGLPAAFQRLPPKGGRSAPLLGVPVRPDLLPSQARAPVALCIEAGNQATVLFNRTSGVMVGAECRTPAGEATPLTVLTADLLSGEAVPDRQ